MDATMEERLNRGMQVFADYQFGTWLKNLENRVAPVFGVSYYVDGTYGYDRNDGLSKLTPFQTIQHAIDTASPYDCIYIKPKKIPVGATDPVDYAENLIIPVEKPGLSLIGFITGRAQGGMPQIKKGSGTAAQITIRAPGCLIANLGSNGGGATGGGILLDDDGSTKTAFGTTIMNCHFKNCVGTTATDARTGGAIMWAATGSAWQVLIQGNRFYKNVGDIVLLGTSQSVPQDVVIENNIFSGPAANVDCNLYLAGGSGMNGVIIRKNSFTAFPAIGSGSVVRFIDATGCIGTLEDNTFADTGTTTGYGVAKAKADIPVTLFMSRNYTEGGLITREA
jgi:hypothetical protein